MPKVARRCTRVPDRNVFHLRQKHAHVLFFVCIHRYVLLCSYPPFDGDSDKDILRSVCRGKYSFPSPEWDNVSPDAKNLIRKLLSKNPKRRPTASEALADDWLHKVGERCKDSYKEL